MSCGRDIWGWLELEREVDVNEFGYGWNNYTGSEQNYAPSLTWREEYKRRCETKDQIFAGGGSQISSIEQDSNGAVYVIGNIRKKAEGALTCNVEFRGPHCVIDAAPALNYTNSAGTEVALTSQSVCSDASGTWVDEGNCSDNSATSALCIDHGRTWSDDACSDSDYNRESTCTPRGTPRPFGTATCPPTFA